MVLRTPPSLTNGEAVGTLILTTVVVVEVSTHKEVVTITTTTIITTITITKFTLTLHYRWSSGWQRRDHGLNPAHGEVISTYFLIFCDEEIWYKLQASDSI